MANKTLFSSATSRLPRANARNEAGGLAYRLPAMHALAQIAATGCFGGVYYANSQAQLDELRTLIDQVDDNVFLAKLAVYSRERAYMKDMPAALLLVLAQRDSKLFHRAFDRVVDNGRVLRTLFQMLRSGQFGRKSLSSSLQRAFQRWLNQASVSAMLSASIGNNPSLRDVLRLARPTPLDNQRRALFGWLTDKPIEKWAPAAENDLPELVRRLVAYRQAETPELQAGILARLNARWDLLADAARGPLVWKAIAQQMGPQALRMNLNTLARHEVLQDSGMVDYLANRIADADEIRRVVPGERRRPVRGRSRVGRVVEAIGPSGPRPLELFSKKRLRRPRSRCAPRYTNSIATWQLFRPWPLKRPFKKRPVTRSSRLARRAHPAAFTALCIGPRCRVAGNTRGVNQRFRAGVPIDKGRRGYYFLTSPEMPHLRPAPPRIDRLKLVLRRNMHDG